MVNQLSAVRVRRHFEGAPIVAPTDQWWENGVTFNAAATYIPQTQANQPLIAGLLAGTAADEDRIRGGLVAIHYRARPRSDPGYLITRSYVGLALFTPELELIHRHLEPIITPDGNKDHPDYLGVEDPRITRFGNRFLMVYCGSGLDDTGVWRGSLCTAESKDLLHWHKCGPMKLRFPNLDDSQEFDQSYFDNLAGATGTTQYINNKDGVLLEGPIDGWYYLLHRPMLGRISDWAIHLARSRWLNGPWTDLGPIARQRQDPDYAEAWIGAGATPIDLGDGRHLEIFHSGHRAADGSRLYTLGAMVLNFDRLDPQRPASLVESRVDHFMVPETRWEIEGPYPDSVGNVLFTCGAFERDDEIHILYGGGDTFVMAASVTKADLLSALAPVTPGDLT